MMMQTICLCKGLIGLGMHWLILGLLSLGSHSFAQTGVTASDGVWQPVAVRKTLTNHPAGFRLAPDRYSQFQLAEEAMRKVLMNASARSGSASATVAGILSFTVPLPNGEQRKFEIHP